MPFGLLFWTAAFQREWTFRRLGAGRARGGREPAWEPTPEWLVGAAVDARASSPRVSTRGLPSLPGQGTSEGRPVPFTPQRLAHLTHLLRSFARRTRRDPPDEQTSGRLPAATMSASRAADAIWTPVLPVAFLLRRKGQRQDLSPPPSQHALLACWTGQDACSVNTGLLQGQGQAPRTLPQDLSPPSAPLETQAR